MSQLKWPQIILFGDSLTQVFCYFVILSDEYTISKPNRWPHKGGQSVKAKYFAMWNVNYKIRVSS